MPNRVRRFWQQEPEITGAILALVICAVICAGVIALGHVFGF